MPEFLTHLDADTLAEAGLSEFSFGYRDRVRFYELDALNHVNNVVFLRWFETIRVAYFQDYGFSKYGPEDPMLVVRRATADFLAPAHQNDEYIVAARTRVIWSLLATMASRVVFVMLLLLIFPTNNLLVLLLYCSVRSIVNEC